jgi:tRNA (guanine-N7-)-methyltransferase
MRHCTNYFRKASLKKIFVCFPDPHFKRKNLRRRIINPNFIAEYSYLLEKGGKLYAITDVHDLHLWHEKHLSVFPLFDRISDEEAESNKNIQ